MPPGRSRFRRPPPPGRPRFRRSVGPPSVLFPSAASTPPAPYAPSSPAATRFFQSSEMPASTALPPPVSLFDSSAPAATPTPPRPAIVPADAYPADTGARPGAFDASAAAGAPAAAPTSAAQPKPAQRAGSAPSPHPAGPSGRPPVAAGLGRGARSPRARLAPRFVPARVAFRAVRVVEPAAGMVGPTAGAAGSPPGRPSMAGSEFLGPVVAESRMGEPGEHRRPRLPGRLGRSRFRGDRSGDRFPRQLRFEPERIPERQRRRRLSGARRHRRAVSHDLRPGSFPAADPLVATGELNQARADQTATLLPDGRVLVAGGSAEVKGSASALASVEIYDPEDPDVRTGRRPADRPLGAHGHAAAGRHGVDRRRPGRGRQRSRLGRDLRPEHRPVAGDRLHGRGQDVGFGGSA